MNCAHRQEQLSGYVDGELTDAERLEMERHLADCPACSEQLDRVRVLAAELGRAPQVAMPADAAARLAAIVDAKLQARDSARRVAAPRPPWWQRLFSPAFATAVASVAVVAVAIVVWSSGSTVTEMSPSSELMRKSAPAEQNVKPPGSKGALSADDEDGIVNEAPEASGIISPSTGRSEGKLRPRIFTEGDLRSLVVDAQAGRISARLESEDEAAQITASEAIKIIAGDSEVELIYAARGLYGDDRRVDEVWIVVFSSPGRPEEAVAAAVSIEGGRILARTD